MTEAGVAAWDPARPSEPRPSKPRALEHRAATEVLFVDTASSVLVEYVKTRRVLRFSIGNARSEVGLGELLQRLGVGPAELAPARQYLLFAARSPTSCGIEALAGVFDSEPDARHAFARMRADDGLRTGWAELCWVDPQGNASLLASFGRGRPSRWRPRVITPATAPVAAIDRPDLPVRSKKGTTAMSAHTMSANTLTTDSLSIDSLSTNTSAEPDAGLQAPPPRARLRHKVAGAALGLAAAVTFILAATGTDSPTRPAPSAPSQPAPSVVPRAVEALAGCLNDIECYRVLSQLPDGYWQLPPDALAD